MSQENQDLIQRIRQLESQISNNAQIGNGVARDEKNPLFSNQEQRENSIKSIGGIEKIYTPGKKR
jgi:hypothetical protein